MNNVNASNDTQNRLVELRSLYRLSNLLAQAPTLAAIFNAARQEIMALTNPRGFSISLLDTDGDVLKWVYGYHNDSIVDLSNTPLMPINEGLSGQVLCTGEVLQLKSREDPLYDISGQFTMSEKAEVWLGLPLIAAEKVIGVLVMENDIPFSQRAVDFLTAVAGSMAVAIHNFRQLKTVQSALSAQSKQRVHLEIAAEIAAATTTILNSDQLIQAVVELIRDRFDYYYVGLFLVDEDAETVVLQGGTGEAGRTLVKNKFKLPLNGKSMVSAAIANSQAHVEQDVRYAEAFYRNPLLPDTKAELAIPLRTHGLITGALTIQSSEIGVFTDETISVFQSLADQLAVAIVNARLFTRIQDNLDKTNRLYEASQQINSAKDAADVYQALIRFAEHSKLADSAFLINLDPENPDSYRIPAFWSNHLTQFEQSHQFPRKLFPASGQALIEEFTILRDCRSDSRIGRFARRLARENEFITGGTIPIKLENEWLATLVLTRFKAVPFSESELQPFHTLVDQSAVILSNQKLLDQAETLHQVGQYLNQSLTREDVYEIAVQKTVKHTGAEQCRFILYDLEAGVGSITAENKPTALAETIRFPIRHDFVYQKLSEEFKPLLLSDQSDVPDQVLEQYVQQFGAEAAFLIPAKSQQKLVGFLGVYSCKGKRPFTQANIIFAQTIVDYVITQIENLNLLEDALNRAQDLITLNQVQSGITGILNLSGLAQRVFDQIGRLLDNTIFILARYHTDSKRYDPILCMLEEKPVHSESREISEDLPLYDFLYGQKPIVADQNHPIMGQKLIPNLRKIPKSSLWIPLLQAGQPTGLISVQSFEPDCYSETDVQLLRSIAIHTSLALANSHLFEEIQTSNEQLRQLDNLKTQFLANMSHELRTPLNSIIGFSRVILKGIDGPLTPAQEEDITSIYQNGQHLLALINEILDMAKIGAGKMSLSFDLIDLTHAAHTALTTARSLIDETSVVLFADIEPNLPLIEADPIRLRQILNNLLSNAAKYTNDGKICLRIREKHSHVFISVEDTGIGIDQKDFETLFKPFEQVDNRNSRVTGGTGLGLPITKWLVRTHNGRLWLESELGQGSTFNVQLPIRQPDDSPTEVSLSESPLVI